MTIAADQLAFALEPQEPAIVVPVSWDVLVHGAAARAVPRHQHVVPITGIPPDVLGALLDFTERELRFNQAGTVGLDLSPGCTRGGQSGSGPFWADAGGITHRPTERRTPWLPLLKALRARRDAEPAIARARDLADAIHSLRYYTFAYEPDPPPPAMIARLRAGIVDLGGDPDLVDVTSRWQPAAKFPHTTTSV